MKIWYIQQMDRDTKDVYRTNKGYSTFEKAKEAFYSIKGVDYPKEGILVAVDEYIEYSVQAMDIE